MQFCNELLAVNWYLHTKKDVSYASDQLDHNQAQGSILYGHHHTNMLEYMEGEKQLDLQNVDPQGRTVKEVPEGDGNGCP